MAGRCFKLTALDVLFHLDQLGFRVLLEGENIRVIPPEGVNLTDELRQAIRKNKKELVALLQILEWAQVKQVLKEKGWITIYSEVLGEIVIWCKDEKVVIPTRWKAAVRYHLAELRELTKQPMTEEDLRLVHIAKKNFNGRFVSKETVK